MGDRFDLTIIGGGPAGYTAAFEAAGLGMRTLLIEGRELGGTCLNRGCIPTKSLLHSAELYSAARGGARFGIHVEGLSYDMGEIQRRKAEVVSELREGLEIRLKKNKITVVGGFATLTDAHTVKSSDGQEFSSERVLIATGSVPAVPPIPGAELPDVVTSDQLLERAQVYPSLVIVGGGVIGMEFASIYSDLGARVTVIEFMDNILPNMDREISRNLKMILGKRGVDIHTSSRVESIAREDGRLVCRYVEKEEHREAPADGILIATGRRPNTDGLFAPGFGVEMERGRIVTDGNGETSVPGVYAVGDVTGGSMLAHAAAAEALNAVRHMAGKGAVYSMDNVPGCVYTNPEIGTVGITQDEAKHRGMDITIKKYPMSANGKTVLAGLERGFIKVVADKSTGRILGAQMMCARATDMISEFTAAIENGLTLESLAKVIYPHPTFSEAIGETVR